MADADDLRRLALSLEGASCAPHFDRTAFKVERIFATMAADRLTANIKLSADGQELKCLTAPDAFKPVAGAWGKQGWTTVTLAALSRDELDAALRVAWQNASPRKRTNRPRKSRR
jgi:hypothetical protein